MGIPPEYSGLLAYMVPIKLTVLIKECCISINSLSKRVSTESQSAKFSMSEKNFSNLRSRGLFFFFFFSDRFFQCCLEVLGAGNRRLISIGSKKSKNL
ncbi:hypothetical protein CANARDRAFT_159917 [[Candida] arabinofermentans NRRL YB-2248]|uniref:Uncharacterized protein n=1 Tax=[Candida] arabinofermentans NRRL YB-2248 TaxID=983967 RepID=A0A1E4T098_9ASCO|nr:hypothetical protein CANARDRAFT_159917 [[Candida] arabinofermentans NRRL YB-2248]